MQNSFLEQARLAEQGFMLQVHKKLKLNTKVVPETVIHIKIYF